MQLCDAGNIFPQVAQSVPTGLVHLAVYVVASGGVDWSKLFQLRD